MQFLGYKREDGSVGTRNYVAIIPSVFCAAKAAELIAQSVPGTVLMRHPVGCGQVGEDFEYTARTLKAMGTHPNIAAVVVVSLGCERFKPNELVEAVRASKRPAEKVSIQEEGGVLQAVYKGAKIAREYISMANQMKREPCDISNLTVALKCGGTDATSGLAANPTLGVMADLIVKNGGSVILSEINELLGTEDMLARRAINDEIKAKIYDCFDRMENYLKTISSDPRYPNRSALISPGNFDGGVSSVVEKALGGVHKSGNCPIVDVLDYSAPPKAGQKGVFLMDSISQDGEVVTGMVGAGAQIVTFTTGRGNPAGFPTVPVIKVTGNEYTYQKMTDMFDLNAGGIINGTTTAEEKGKELFDLVIRTASGLPSKAEVLKHDELFCITRKA